MPPTYLPLTGSIRRIRLSGYLCAAFAWLIASGWSASPLFAQNYAEFRLAGSDGGTYRYAEFTHTFPQKVVVDLIYLGVPRQNEFYGGLGYQIKVSKSLVVTPLFYGVLGNENSEKGVAPGVSIYGNHGRWNLNGFLGHFEPLKGRVPRYTFLDTLDVTKKQKKVEIGLSSGFYHIAGTWNPLVGPILVKNDERGSWRLAIRGGSAFEARLTRTLSF